MKIIFLDIDGVLNRSGDQCYWIRTECVQHLNDIIMATSARIVISSSWRQLIHHGYLTTEGFLILLRSHGLTPLTSIVGVTRETNHECMPDWRRNQISDWIRACDEPLEAFVILDDDHIEGYGERFIQTNGASGLTADDAARAIAALEG